MYLSPGPTDGGWKPPQEGQPGTRYKNKFNLEVWRAKIKLIRTDTCSFALGKLSGTVYCSKNGIFTAETWTLYDSRTGRHCSQSERLNHQQHRYLFSALHSVHIELLGLCGQCPGEMKEDGPGRKESEHACSECFWRFIFAFVRIFIGCLNVLSIYDYVSCFVALCT